MSLSRRIFYNTLVQTLGKVLAVAIGLTTISLLTQYLREKGFGGYSTVIAFLSLFSVMADLGLYLYVVREISRPGADTEKILSNSFGLRLVGAIATLCIGAFASLLFPYDPIVKEAMFIGIAAYVFTSVTRCLSASFKNIWFSIWWSLLKEPGER
jgi:O-antigen/teichoic acid export membrane protein